MERQREHRRVVEAGRVGRRGEVRRREPHRRLLQVVRGSDDLAGLGVARLELVFRDAQLGAERRPTLGPFALTNTTAVFGGNLASFCSSVCVNISGRDMSAYMLR